MIYHRTLALVLSVSNKLAIEFVFFRDADSVDSEPFPLWITHAAFT